jgi:hypothetical protein
MQAETVDDDNKEDEFITPPTCNKRCRRNKNNQQMTINPDFLSELLVGEEGNSDNETATMVNDDAIKRERQGQQKFKMMAKVDWKKISATHPGQPIEPIPYTGASQFFGVNLFNCEIEGMKDENGDIRYKKK